MILIGVASLMALVTLRQTQGGPDAADPATLVATGRSWVAVRDATFLLGPGIVPALNALLLAPILYRARLVPRILPLVGLVGAPLLLASPMARITGHSIFSRPSGTSTRTAPPQLPPEAGRASLTLTM